VLDVREVTVLFGGRVAVDDVSIHAGAGEVVGLIGSNGAGKSTLLNVVSGFVRPRRGIVRVAGVDVTHELPHERARRGVGRVFQDARLFGDLTVRETVMVALEAHERAELVPSLLALPPSVRLERRRRGEAEAYVDLLGLGRYADTCVAELSTGTRRILELTCLLAQQPRLVLLDEPTAGVAQRETEQLGPLLLRVRDELGATIVLIEHDMPLVLSVSDRLYCLAAGSCIAEGPPTSVRENPAVVAAYLGTDERAIARSGVVR
jgi:ABC-type branched-subunit amino acid transport system ATPase component